MANIVVGDSTSTQLERLVAAEAIRNWGRPFAGGTVLHAVDPAQIEHCLWGEQARQYPPVAGVQGAEVAGFEVADGLGCDEPVHSGCGRLEVSGGGGHSVTRK